MDASETGELYLSLLAATFDEDKYVRWKLKSLNKIKNGYVLYMCYCQLKSSKQFNKAQSA